MKQINPTDLVGGKYQPAFRKKKLRTARKQVRLDRSPKRHSASQVRAQWSGQTPFYNFVNIDNSTPFAQGVTVNPNIECMWTGGVSNSNSQSAVSDVLPGGTLQFVYEASSTESAWPGLIGATKGLNAPGTQGNLMGDVVNAANATLTNVESSLENPATYSESGAATAAASAALTFVVSFIGGLFDMDTCTDVSEYPELFGVSTQVIGFGSTTAALAAKGTYPSNAPWTGTPQVGSQPYTPPANPSALTGDALAAWNAFLSQDMQPLLGAQTTAMYYWNGGQPAYMVSNNNNGTSNFGGGSASFTGGLFQSVGPNPGTPGVSQNCTTYSGTWSCGYSPPGSMTVQLTYLSNPGFTSGLWNQGTGVPELTVTTNSDGSQYSLQCNLSAMDATLSTPFGPTSSDGVSEVQSSTMMSVPLNSSGTTASDGLWTVNFYGIGPDKNGNNQFVYYGQEWMSQGVQTNVAGNSVSLAVPNLGPNAGPAQVTIPDAASTGSQTTPQATVYLNDMDDMYSATGEPITPTTFGCNATPSVNLKGLSIVDSAVAANFGNINPNNNQGWPMPGNHTGWPTTSFTPYDTDTNWSWQWPVNQINVSFKGLPVGDTAPVPSPS